MTKIFCIGLGRSGTATFGECMQVLGYRHLGRTSTNNRVRAVLDVLSVLDYDAFIKTIESFESIDDYPIPLLYRKLHASYPDAKFVLTRRASVEKWVDSVILEYNRKSWNEGESFWFSGTFSDPARREILTARYSNHLESVREFFRGSPNFLEVCWEEGDGWQQLCSFLGRETPDTAFPHLHAKTTSKRTDMLAQMLSERRYHKALLFAQEADDLALLKGMRDWSMRFVMDNIVVLRGSPVTENTRRPGDAIPAPKSAARPRKKHKLAACSIFRDEGKFLGEWLDFHACMGVSHFYLYNDNSSDDYQRILEPWIRKGRVTLTDWPIRSQVDAFNHCLRLNRELVQWMAFIDIDEFLFSPRSLSLPQVLSDHDEHAAVFVFWALFGSGGHEEPPGPSVLESYRMRQSAESARHDSFDHGIRGTPGHITAWSRDGKSIAQTDAVLEMSNHIPVKYRWGRAVDERGVAIPVNPQDRRLSGLPFTFDKLRINHYWSKSIRDLTRRSERGSVYDRSRPPKQLERLLLRERQLNDVYDETIISVWQTLRSAGVASDR